MRRLHIPSISLTACIVYLAAGCPYNPPDDDGGGPWNGSSRGRRGRRARTRGERRRGLRTTARSRGADDGEGSRAAARIRTAVRTTDRLRAGLPELRGPLGNPCLSADACCGYASGDALKVSDGVETTCYGTCESASESASDCFVPTDAEELICVPSVYCWWEDECTAQGDADANTRTIAAATSAVTLRASASARGRHVLRRDLHGGDQCTSGCCVALDGEDYGAMRAELVLRGRHPGRADGAERRWDQRLTRAGRGQGSSCSGEVVTHLSGKTVTIWLLMSDGLRNSRIGLPLAIRSAVRSIPGRQQYVTRVLPFSYVLLSQAWRRRISARRLAQCSVTTINPIRQTSRRWPKPMAWTRCVSSRQINSNQRSSTR